ncbi:MAG: hypothetical protein RBU31_09960, partial [Syntrophales bacterium]|nr:hypothetical protein [Syntrophales bacterium]
PYPYDNRLQEAASELTDLNRGNDRQRSHSRDQGAFIDDDAPEQSSIPFGNQNMITRMGKTV